MPNVRTKRGALALGAALALAAPAAPGAAEAPAATGGAGATHAAIDAYQGTRTCAACHRKQVKDVAASLHYQQQGPAPFLASAQQGKNAGMMVSY